MEIRKSTVRDIPMIMQLIHQAQAYFKASHIDQWQDGYPQEDNILADIAIGHSYVLDVGQVLATMYFAIEDDPSYKIIAGEWKTNQQPYAVIHRIVVDEGAKGQGLAKDLLDYVSNECHKFNIHSIRVDTHADNLSMQRFLTKNNFVACGQITLESGAPRIGFEKILNK